jgi:DNA topoisomerase-1
MSDINTSANSMSTPAGSAHVVGLCYVNNDRPGIRRQRCGRGFRYRSAEGRIVRDRHTLKRISSLVIPPAWKEVWICPIDQGHLQATGRDERGRKQHLYHPRWREMRDQTKYDRLMDFARALPNIRKRLRRDLAREGLCREKVLATVVRLLEVSLIRVGNDEYARDNKSYGLTTMKNRHATVRGAKITFQFRGKSGKEHVVEVEDRRIARIVRACQDLPGQELFQYVDSGDQKHDVGSGDVNDYLRELTGQDFTAKDFRTWAGTVSAASELRQLGPADSETDARKNVVTAIKTIAQILGNTPAVCRKSYVHPKIIEAYLDGSLIPKLSEWKGKMNSNSSRRLRPDEIAVLRFLKHTSNERRKHTRRRVNRRTRVCKNLAST